MQCNMPANPIRRQAFGGSPALPHSAALRESGDNAAV
jgi:hypothetical protein